MSRFFVEETEGKAFLYLKRQVYGRRRLPLKGFSFEALWDIKHEIDSGGYMRIETTLGGDHPSHKLMLGTRCLMTVFSAKELYQKLIPFMEKLASYGIPKGVR